MAGRVFAAQPVPIADRMRYTEVFMHIRELFSLAGQVRFMAAHRAAVEKGARGLSIPRLLACYNELLRIRMVSQHPLNAQLFLEDLAARFLMAIATKP